MSDPQEQAEALDADKIDDAGDVAGILEAYPPDRPVGVGDWGSTADEERRPEPLGEFVRREENDPLRDVLEQEAEERP